jgi:NADH:ubiquinone oxidoreductase subunit 4 (subunit M)
MPPPPIPKKSLTRATARTAVVVNQLATPGLGSLLARRWVAGTGQLALSLAGFGFVLWWFGVIMVKYYSLISDPDRTPPPTPAWIGITGAVLHSVSHGLVSAAMFLLAAMLIQRTGTDRFADLGGLARGRPVLATSVLIVGMLTLAVPGSANFAGEFAILAGVFAQGWGYAVVGAVAIVLAAMYSLRLISAVLHRAPGSAVREESLDLRFGELLLIVPLIAILLALSVWPASISENTFPKDPPTMSEPVAP